MDGHDVPEVVEELPAPRQVEEMLHFPMVRDMWSGPAAGRMGSRDVWVNIGEKGKWKDFLMKCYPPRLTLATFCSPDPIRVPPALPFSSEFPLCFQLLRFCARLGSLMGGRESLQRKKEHIIRVRYLSMSSALGRRLLRAQMITTYQTSQGAVY
jgi:hypothetical protein